MKGYKNVIFELWNEPHGDDQAKQSWFNVTQRTIDAIRETGAQQLIVIQWDYASWINLDHPTGGSKLDWIWEANLNDPLGNLVYSTHLYRSYAHIQIDGDNAWNLTDIDLGFELMKYYDAANTYPLFVGEIGASLGYTGTELEHELTAFDNSLQLFEAVNF